MRILFDTNVVLDVLTDGKPCLNVASLLFSNVEEYNIKGFATTDIPVFTPDELMKSLIMKWRKMLGKSQMLTLDPKLTIRREKFARGFAKKQKRGKIN